MAGRLSWPLPVGWNIGGGVLIADIHLFPNTEEGHALVQQLQQRAEGWAQAGIMTMIFTTDDHCEILCHVVVADSRAT